MFKRILHPTDFSDVSLQAFEQAVALALRYGAKLELFHAVVLHQYDKSVVDRGLKKLNEAYEAIRIDLKNQMLEMVNQSDIRDDLCGISVKRGLSPGALILNHAEEKESDLIVMGTHGRSPARHFFLGSVAENVVRYAPCPVMVLGRQEDNPGKFQRILLPIDFSIASHRSAELAFSLARIHRAELHLIHVYQDILPPIYYFHSENVIEWDSGLKKRGEKAVLRFLTEHQIDGVKVATHFVEGGVSGTILKFCAEKDIDLVVMGTAGLRGVHRFMIGSRTEQVLRSADLPVLTVRGGGGA